MPKVQSLAQMAWLQRLPGGRLARGCECGFG